MAFGCEGETDPFARCEAALVYDPATEDSVSVWPDPIYLTEDASSPTGVRLALTSDRARWVGEVAPQLQGAVATASDFTGFARLGGATFSFSEAPGNLPGTAQESLESEFAQYFDLSTSPPTRIPFLVETSSNGKIVSLVPVGALASGRDYLVVLSEGLSTESAGCMGPSETAARVYDPSRGGADARFEGVLDDYSEAFDAAAVDPSRVVAATVYRTHANHADVVAAREAIELADHDWVNLDCGPYNGMQVCNGAFTADDYRDADLRIGAVATQRWNVPVTIWMPLSPGPHPVIFFGHGIYSSRDRGEAIAETMVPEGFAVVASDALRHGEHPLGPDSGDVLGFDLTDLDNPINLRAMRSNFNQTILDRLQLMKLIAESPDLEVDDQIDLDASRITYWGISLGAMFGAGLMALDDSFDAGVFTIGGGRLARFLDDSSIIASVRPVFSLLVGGDNKLFAFLAMSQSLLDDADPATWADHVLDDRLVGEHLPSILFPVSVFDPTVPPIAGRTMAMSFGVPHVAPVIEDVAGLEQQTAPAAGNFTVGGSTITAGYFQYDRTGDPPEMTGHNVGAEGRLQAEHFLTTWRDTGIAEIIDPYLALGTPAL